MGACNFIDFKAAETAEEAFGMLVSEAFNEHGHDPLQRHHIDHAPHW